MTVFRITSPGGNVPVCVCVRVCVSAGLKIEVADCWIVLTNIKQETSLQLMLLTFLQGWPWTIPPTPPHPTPDHRPPEGNWFHTHLLMAGWDRLFILCVCESEWVSEWESKWGECICWYVVMDVCAFTNTTRTTLVTSVADSWQFWQVQRRGVTLQGGQSCTAMFQPGLWCVAETLKVTDLR